MNPGSPPGTPAGQPFTEPAPRLVWLVRRKVLDPELGALLGLLVDGGLSLVVAGPPDTEVARTGVLAALLQAAPTAADRPPLDLAGLGADVRALLRSASLGATFAGWLEAGSLEQVVERLRDSGAGEDEVSYLGVVVVLDGQGRVGSAHYVRPVALDGHGHVQRLGPAVLAARDATSGRLEHFAWGVMPELADRLRLPARDLEDEVEKHRAVLGHLAGLHG